MVRKALLVLVVALPLAFGIAACGDDDDEGDTAAATTESTSTEEATTDQAASGGGGGETVDVSLVDVAIEPTDGTAAAGTVTFAVSNDGQTVHNLEVEGNGVEEELEPDLQPGDSGELTVDLASGTFEWYCPVGNHADMGMEGELTVE